MNKVYSEKELSAAVTRARADALAELHPAWVAAHERADRAEREVSAAVARAAAEVRSERDESTRAQKVANGGLSALLDYFKARAEKAEAALAAQAAPVAESDCSMNLTHEREFLEDWLRTTAEPTGLECCGHGIGSECCGNPDAAYLSFDEFITAMSDRLKAVTALLAAHTQQEAA